MAGYILRYGKAGYTDMKGAREWYEKAAAKGHPDGFVALGEMGIRGQAGLTKSDASQRHALLELYLMERTALSKKQSNKRHNHLGHFVTVTAIRSMMNLVGRLKIIRIKDCHVTADIRLA